MNALDRAISWMSPSIGMRRAQARTVLSYYEAAQPSRLRKSRRERGSSNASVIKAGASLREIARHLEQNHDLARGVLSTLVTNTVGANGIGVEPQPRNADGSINEELARQLSELWKDWCCCPEVTGQHDYPSMLRLLARSWFRDGEVFGQTISGPVSTLHHHTRVPFSVEMLEADCVPMDKQSAVPAVSQGIELNAWGAPVAYHVYKTSPIDGLSVGMTAETKRIPAESMLHVKSVDRIRQLRGVTVFASVLTRFEDLKEYEESERIAAKIAASMAAFIKKGQPDTYQPAIDERGNAAPPRHLSMRPGMIFDDLLPGEDIGTIDTNRPNPNLQAYRNGQLKAVAAGTGATFSSIARSYDGTYSAQRQELVEGYGAYASLSSEFIGRIVRPMWERFVQAAVAARMVKIESGVISESIDDATFVPPAMPWIDPKKEIEAWALAEDRAYISGPEIIRKRGGNPHDTLQQQAKWLQAKSAAGIRPPGQATESPVDPRTEEDQLALAKARQRVADAEAGLSEVRTRQQEQLGELRLSIAQAQLQLIEAQIRASNAQADAADAKFVAAKAERAHSEARAERERVEARIAEETVAADAASRDAEHAARLEQLEQQAQGLRQAERERQDAAEAARAHARDIQAVELKTAQANLEAAEINVQAQREALDELRSVG